MKIVIAPDSFKESLSALEVANAIEQGFSQIFPDAEYIKVPVADGGEGTVQSMIDASQGHKIELDVTGPLGEQVAGFYGLLGDETTAIIEMAAASGLHHVSPEQRNPLLTSSFGTGELILDALNQGVEKIILGLGGSATNDGGAGMMKALGARFYNEHEREIPMGGRFLKDIHRIDLSELDARLKQIQFEVACDVDNPLCGDKGASAVFGPQKGATPEMVKELDQSLEHYARTIRQQLNKDVLNTPGAGAAGGMGAAVLAFLDANLRPGIDIVMETVELADKVQGAQLVITGEGRIDSQTIHGKTPVGVARIAQQAGAKVIGIAGCLSDDCHVVHEHGLDAVFAIVPRSMPLEEALKTGADNLRLTSRNLAAMLKFQL